MGNAKKYKRNHYNTAISNNPADIESMCWSIVYYIEPTLIQRLVSAGGGGGGN